MADGYRMIERWTLRSLAGAFLELAIAYIFLCAAAVAFAAAKFFSFFGVGVDLDLSCRHSPPPFPLRPTLPADCPRPLPPPRPPSCCPPHRPLLILDSNNTVSGDHFSEWESESESERDETSIDDQEIDGNCDLTLEKLKWVMEEERAAREAVSRELEKERSAAASAADEAMAMMLRLQEEKAAAEIEARQYRRMAEEKSAYDAEEMETLKEIIVRREREKLVLEMQLEECQQLIMLMNDNDSGGSGGSSGGDSGDDGSRECRCRDVNVRSVDQDEGATDKEEVAGIYDVHVIDDHNMSLDDDRNAEHLKPTESGSSEAAATADQSCDISRSLSVIDVEKLVLGNEVVLLRKKQEALQQGREKLRFPLDRTEKETLRLQILKEISYQLEEIKKSTEEAGEATLPQLEDQQLDSRACAREECDCYGENFGSF